VARGALRAGSNGAMLRGHMGRGCRPIRAGVVSLARILIVDDEGPVRKLLGRIVSQLGHQVTLAGNADEAVQLLRDDRTVELVLTDVRMPGTSGLDLATQIGRDFHGTAVVMVSGVDDPETAGRAIETGVYGYVLKPFRATEIQITVMNALRRRAVEVENRRHREVLEDLVAGRTSELRLTLDLLAQSNRKLNEAQEEIIKRLSIASEVRDEETGAHIHRMSAYSAILADEVGLEPERCELIRVASPLHDVGKIGVPDSILRKPGKHTPDEFEVMKQHAVFGYRTLTGTGFALLDVAATIAWTHHERWEGSGYPRGLKGDQIPIEGRIVAIADVYDALTTKRVYKPAFTVERSLEIMREGKGRHFDPILLECFFRRFDEIQAVQRRFPDQHPDEG
jgi:putative two-component system response regulator